MFVQLDEEDDLDRVVVEQEDDTEEEEELVDPLPLVDIIIVDCASGCRRFESLVAHVDACDFALGEKEEEGQPSFVFHTLLGSDFLDGLRGLWQTMLRDGLPQRVLPDPAVVCSSPAVF
jgi:hypothetical protein